MLNAEQKNRYARNIAIAGIGAAGQDKLLSSRVLVIGAGGLGSPVILYLAAAGVGMITIADDDRVELSNLQRQVLYSDSDTGDLKAVRAAERARELNRDVEAEAVADRITYANLPVLAARHDFIVECSDNIETKFMVNSVCTGMKKPFSHCGVTALAGQIMTYLPGHACINCAFASDRGSADEQPGKGILGAAAGVMGSLQAAEAVKYLTGCGACLTDAFFDVDLAACLWKKIRVRKKKQCSCRE